jgi:hypothetical protein
MTLILLALLTAAPAWAGPNSGDPSASLLTESARLAEYKRLHEELERLVKRNAWAGAERTFQSMTETGVELRFEDLKLAAQVAQATGSISVVHERLLRAAKLQEDREVLEALYAIDENFGVVFLAGDPGKVELAATVMPFDPSQARAVEHAVHMVRQTGIFEGMLPKGTYVFAGREVEVRPRVTATRIDLRTDGGVRKSTKAQKKADKSN